MNELNEYLESGQEPELKKKPKKFGNAFTFYLRDKKEEVRHQYPELSMAEIMSVIAKMWKEAPPAEKQKYNRISEEDKMRYKHEIEELAESSAPFKVNKKVKLLKNAQKLEKTIDELIQQSLEKTNNKISQFKEQVASKQPGQSSQILEEFSKAIQRPLELLKSKAADQGHHHVVKKEHIEEEIPEPRLSLSQRNPSFELWPFGKMGMNRQESFPAPLFDHQNSFERVKITYPSLDTRNPSAKKESVFYLKDFSFKRENSLENFLQRQNSDIFAGYANPSIKKDQPSDAIYQNDNFSLFGDFTKNNSMFDAKNLEQLAPEESKNVSTTNDSHSIGYGADQNPMAMEDRFDDVIGDRGNEKGRCFNSVIADAITMDSSLYGSGDFLAFDSFMK